MASSTPASATAEAPRARGASTSPWREAWRRFRRHRLALLSLWVLGRLALLVALGPYLWRVPLNDIDFSARLAGPSLRHPMGTDTLVQDLLARILYGGRISLAVGLAAMLIAIFAGVVVGAIAGISRGPLDAALISSSRTTSRWSSTPAIGSP